jgi:hypothetical protein
MKKVYVAAVGVLALGVSIAGVAHAAMNWGSSVRITMLSAEGETSGSGGTMVTDTFVKFSATPIANNCSSNTWVMGGSPDNIKAMTQLALAAKLAGKDVKIGFNNSYSGFDSCNGGGTNGHPKIRAIQIP